MQKPFTYYLGNVMIILALFGLGFIVYPVINAYIVTSSPPSPTSRAFALWIPKIHAAGKIIPDVDPWVETSYKPALRRGIALAKGFAVPGEKGTAFLFAHSSGPPWELTRYNTVFLRLGELEKGDDITIWHNNKELHYKVRTKKTVNPSEINEVVKSTRTQIILQTCTPIGTDFQRLLIFADPV